MDDPPAVSRRRVLGTLGAAVAGSLAGCPGTGGRGWTDRPGDGLTPADVPTLEPTATPRSRPITDVPCPPVPVETPAVNRRCRPTEDGVAAGLQSDTASADLPRASVRVQFYNDSRTPLSGLLPPWSLQKYVGGSWYTVLPQTVRSGVDRSVTGGRGRRTWELAIDNSAARWLDPRDEVGLELDDAATRIPVAGLGGGVYAFVVGGWFGPRETTAPVAFGARFRLDGPRLSLTPTDTVEGVTRAGSTITVRADPGLGEQATFILSSSRRWADAQRLLLERAVRNPVLRNLLAAYTPDTGRVVLHTRRHPAYPPVRPRTFTVGGTGFRVQSGTGDNREAAANVG